MPKKPDLLKEFDKLGEVEREELLFRLTQRDKSLLYRLYEPWMAQHKYHSVRFPGIVRTPGACGGSARFIRTRIPVWTVVRMQQLGVSDADILRSYPSLRAVDLAEAWAFADAHKEEIEKDIRENEEE